MDSRWGSWSDLRMWLMRRWPLAWAAVLVLLPLGALASGAGVALALLVLSGTLDDRSPRIFYSGRWQAGLFAPASGGTATYSDQPGAAVLVPFEGRRLELVQTRTFNRGLARIAVDGVEVRTVDLHSPVTRWQERTVVDGLPPGRHWAEIRVLGRHNPASSGDFVDLDAVRAE